MSEKSPIQGSASPDQAISRQEAKNAYLKEIRDRILHCNGEMDSIIFPLLDRLEMQGGPDPFFNTIEAQMDAVQDTVNEANQEILRKMEELKFVFLLKIIGTIGDKKPR
jgi:hypothetical protein